ncbi:hypothetical protein ACI6QG_06625 [Roseococcus sp. DSY-14]|uniref:hypothetical protein n=1 Tax=Roseococcus sp. DSY-14 TaxID=3369650 RepID=UPI00387AE436
MVSRWRSATIMAPFDALSDAAKEAAIRDLLARTPVAPRDPLRTRIMQAAQGVETMLAALDFARPDRKAS